MRNKTSLADCGDLIRAGTAAEMIHGLCQRAADEGMGGEELAEYCIFVGAAVHAVVSELPEFIRPANIGADVLRLIECCRSVNDLTGGIDRGGGGMRGGQ